MRYSFLKRFVALSFITVFYLSACHTGQDNSSLSDFISSDKSTQDVLPEPPAKNTEIWDVSDVDISHIDLNRKLISFTFDDAPSRTLENIFAVFADFNEENPDCKASATLFFNGIKFDAQTPHLLATATLLHFELGNHTHSHFDLTKLTSEQLQTEIDKTDELLSKADGKKRHLLRAPFGKLNDDVKKQAQAPWINWTIDTLDWTGIDETSIYEKVMTKRFDGAIVLMHDGYTPTVSALKRLLPDLKADGYQIVSVSQLIKAHNRTFYNGKEYIRALKK